MSNKHAHLEMIQGVINRLAQNSFTLKGWSVVIVSALFALAAKGSDFSFIFLAFFPAFSFWTLDGYFLQQERLFRALYDHVRKKDDNEIDYSMNVSVVMDKVNSWFSVMFSRTILIFHGIIILSIVIVSVVWMK